MGDRIGLDVGQPVLGDQAELVVAEHRVGLDQRVPGRAGVELEAGQQELLGRDAAAGRRARIEHQAAVSGPRQVGGGDQAVVARAGNDDVRYGGRVGAQTLTCAGSRRVTAPPR